MNQEKKFKFIQHIPTFFDGIEKETIYFNNIDELLETELLKRLSHSSVGNEFHRFSLNYGEYQQDIRLMAEYNNNEIWWVCGFISGEKEDLEDLSKLLPEWHANKEASERRRKAHKKRNLFFFKNLSIKEKVKIKLGARIRRKRRQNFRKAMADGLARLFLEDEDSEISKT